MPEIDIKSRFWITVDGLPYLGNGRVALLEAIDKHGSISSAAKEIGVSYRKAWKLIESVNNAANEALVIKSAGGKQGGGTVLTDHAKETIAKYRQLQQSCESFLKDELEKCCF